MAHDVVIQIKFLDKTNTRHLVISKPKV